jgi:tetratricopeptide (TPR) repeat protein
MNAKSISPWLLALGLFAASALCLQQGRRSQAASVTLPSALAQPLPPHLTRSALIAGLGSMRRAGADSAYIDALQYVGDSRNRFDGRYKDLYSLYRSVLWIDPYFHFAVLEGASDLGWNVLRVDEAQELLEAAIQVDPSFGRYKLYYAALAYQKVDKDPGRVLKLLQDEVRRPDTPEMLVRMVGNLYMKFQRWKEAKAYCTDVYLNTESLENREWALHALQEMASKGH